MQQFRILYQDDCLVAIEKPSGFHVHPPEDQRHRISNAVNCLAILRNQIGRYLYPVHRLDGATSGVLIFALNSESAALIQAQFQNQTIKKTYFAVVRGWVESDGVIDHPLSSDGESENRLESKTSYSRVGQVELPVVIARYPTARYSLVRVHPHTGRMHQIRRHFLHLRHPLIGDTIYGDGKHNRFFRDKIGGSGLFLKAYSLSMTHPVSQMPLTIVSRWNHQWHQMFDLFGICPRV
jgi:tRNA pseudouridine65 synthase